MGSEGRIELSVETYDPYTIHGELFAKAIFVENLATKLIVDAIRNMDTIEAIFASEKLGDWVVPEQS